MPKRKVAVLISGNGSNLQALIDAASDPDYPAEIVLVLSNKADAFGLTRAENAHIPTEIISHKDFSSRETFDEAIHNSLANHNIEVVCLAGFMRILTAEFTSKWEGKMINIHPSLLPDFKGLDTHKRAIDAGRDEAGCTVHFVVPEMDAGSIILQAHVPIEANDTPESLAARVLTQEHVIYPQALAMLASGEI
jgi:phosphoribosylglycinamide formyltransferase-1